MDSVNALSVYWASMRSVQATRAMEYRGARGLLLAAALVFVVTLCSCSINRFAVRTVAGFLTGSGEGTVFTGEDDPELVGDALPFAMKMYESLLAEDPDNAPLALATGRAFTSYAFAFVQAPSDQLPVDQVDAQRAMRMRAKKLFLRGRDYIFRGIDSRRPGFTAALNGSGPAAALRLVRKEDVDYLYWAAAAWMGAFSADPFDFALIVAVPRAVALLKQVDAWDGSYGAGAVDEIFISFYGGAPPDLGGGEDKARASFDLAVSAVQGPARRAVCRPCNRGQRQEPGCGRVPPAIAEGAGNRRERGHPRPPGERHQPAQGTMAAGPRERPVPG